MSSSASGPARPSPYGICDIATDSGWVSVGTDAGTAAFAVNTLRTWWTKVGKPAWPSPTTCCPIPPPTFTGADYHDRLAPERRCQLIRELEHLSGKKATLAEAARPNRPYQSGSAGRCVCPPEYRVSIQVLGRFARGIDLGAGGDCRDFIPSRVSGRTVRP